MDREKLRRDILKRLEHPICEVDGLQAVLMRVQAGFSDPEKCPVCFYLHGRQSTMRKTVSPIGDVACEACGYEEHLKPRESSAANPSLKLSFAELCVVHLP